MNQELIDFLRGELDDEHADRIRARLRSDAALAREYAELEALFGLMRRGEELDPSAALRQTVMAAAERSCRPSWAERLRALPGLFRFRFQRSLGFRVAIVSLAAHLLLMAVLFQVTVIGPRRPGGLPEVVVRPSDDTPVHRPEPSFAIRLLQRRLPHDARLAQVGVPGQADAIRDGLARLRAGQREDGSFGDLGATGYAALALLAEGDSSTLRTEAGTCIRAAIRHLIERTRAGEYHGAALSALVEDYALSYRALGEQERTEYVTAILGLIRRAGADEASREGLALARLCGLPVPSDADLGEAAALLGGARDGLLDRAPDRLAATAALAKGRTELDPERLRAWARPLFERSLRELEGGGGALALLALQAPYRL